MLTMMQLDIDNIHSHSNNHAVWPEMLEADLNEWKAPHFDPTWHVLEQCGLEPGVLETSLKNQTTKTMKTQMTANIHFNKDETTE